MTISQFRVSAMLGPVVLCLVAGCSRSEPDPAADPTAQSMTSSRPIRMSVQPAARKSIEQAEQIILSEAFKELGPSEAKKGPVTLWSEGNVRQSLKVNRRSTLRWPAKYPSATIHDLAWSPEGQTLAVAGLVLARESELFHSPTRLYDQTGKLLAELNSKARNSSDVSVSHLEWSPNGAVLAASNGLNWNVTLYSVRDGSQTETKNCNGAPHYSKWSPDGSLLATVTGNRELQLYDAAGQLKGKYGPTGYGSGSFAWHPDGKSIASLGKRGLMIWDVENNDPGKPLLKPAVRAIIPYFKEQHAMKIAWSPDGSVAAICSFGTGTVWIVDRRAKPVARLDGHTESVWAVEWSKHGVLATASGDCSVRLWKPDGTLIKTLVSTTKAHQVLIDVIEWSPDGKWLCVASPRSTLRIWAATGEPVATLSGHTDRIHAVAWSPDGKLLASADEDENTIIWELQQIEAE